jgi:hypothetical protein
MITLEHIEKAYSYNSYRELIEKLMKEGKTTGENHSPEYLHYTELNIHRMNRWDKTAVISEEFSSEIKKINKKIYMVAITEAWCGDAANLIPIFEKIRLQNPDFLSLHLLLRDENPEIMNDHLTNGSRSIPKLIFLNENLEKLASWGPRPQPLMELIKEWKSQGLNYSQFSDKIQVWYSKDKSLSTQKEIVEILKSL